MYVKTMACHNLAAFFLSEWHTKYIFRLGGISDLIQDGVWKAKMIELVVPWVVGWKREVRDDTMCFGPSNRKN